MNDALRFALGIPAPVPASMGISFGRSVPMKRLCVAAASILGLSLWLSGCAPVGGMQPASDNNAPHAAGSSGSDGGGGSGGGTGY